MQGQSVEVYAHTSGSPRGAARGYLASAVQQYNQSLRALRAGGFDVQQEEYWDCLRAGAEHYLKPDPQVGQSLLPSLEALQSAVSACWLHCNTAHLPEGVTILCRWLLVTMNSARTVAQAWSSQGKTKARWHSLKCVQC